MQPRLVLLDQVLRLLSWEAASYCLHCSLLAKSCTCAVFEPIEEDGISVLVGDLLTAKRTHTEYARLREDLRSLGQREPLLLCDGGCCLLNGHHRAAAMAELGFSTAWVLVSAEPCLDYPGDDDEHLGNRTEHETSLNTRLC